MQNGRMTSFYDSVKDDGSDGGSRVCKQGTGKGYRETIIEEADEMDEDRDDDNGKDHPSPLPASSQPFTPMITIQSSSPPRSSHNTKINDNDKDNDHPGFDIHKDRSSSSGQGYAQLRLNPFDQITSPISGGLRGLSLGVGAGVKVGAEFGANTEDGIDNNSGFPSDGVLGSSNPPDSSLVEDNQDPPVSTTITRFTIFFFSEPLDIPIDPDSKAERTRCQLALSDSVPVSVSPHPSFPPNSHKYHSSNSLPR